MNKKIFGVISIAVGTASLMYCIMSDTDGIGRAVLFFFGVALIAFGTGTIYFKK